MLDIGHKSMPSVMTHSFSRVPQANIPRSQFKRLFRHTTCLNADYLVPVLAEEILPGDTVDMSFDAIVRWLTPLAPTMDNLYCDLFYFYCPNRLVQTNWVKLMGEQDDPADSIDFTTPYFDTTATTGFVGPTDFSALDATDETALLFDYLDIPMGVPDLRVNTHVHRMYNLIWNEWFRDQNLQDSVTVDMDDGPDTPTDYKLLKRGKRHDYFTSCLPWPQKGTAETISIGTSAPVKGIAVFDTATYSSNETSKHESGAVDAQSGDWQATSANTWILEDSSNANYPNIYADLTAATGFTIDALYQSVAIQRLLLNDARGGTRYTELVRAHFGVTSPDSRLQRPEYLGGGSYPIQIAPLAQTSETSGSNELGQLAATATGLINAARFVKSFVEHGWLICLMNIRADLTYSQGLPRKYSRSTRYDYYFPELANLGEQSVLNKELWAQGSADATADAATFGYQERWAEYKYGKAMMTSRMRPDDANSLDLWHLSEDFATIPSLNAAFITPNTPIARASTVTTEPHFIADIQARSTWTRPMPLYSVPGLQNRF